MNSHSQNTAERPPVWAMILGAVRNRAEFDPLYAWATDARNRGLLDGVVFISWNGQYSSDPELLSKIESDGHRLIELDEPWMKVANYGHIFHQMKALFYGLHCCPENSYVLKLRTDKYGEVSALETLLAARSLPQCDLSAGWPVIFENRIYTLCAAILNPFFINDIVYYGRRTDLQKLVNFDLRFIEIYKRMIPEQWFFANPFIKHFPLFEDYFCIQPRLGVGGLPGTYRFVDVVKQEPFLMHVITTYHQILERYFIVGDINRASGKTSFSGDLRPRDFGALFHDSLPQDGIFKHPAGGWPFASAHQWLDLIEQGTFYPCDLWNRYSQSRSVTRNMQFHNSYVPCPLLMGELKRLQDLIENDVCNFPEAKDATIS